MAKAKNKGGRPTVMTEDRQEDVLKCISLGMTRERAAAYAGISIAVFYAHQQRYPEFQERVKQAESKCQAHCLAAIRKAGMPRYQDKTRTRFGPPGRDGKPTLIGKTVEHTKKDEGEWEASAWLLERRWPNEYGKVDRHLIHTTSREGGPMEADYIAAIQRALGMHGQLIPIGEKMLAENSNGQGDVIDMDVLPQD